VTLLVTWAACPLLLLVLAVGWGLLADLLLGTTLPRALIPGLGLASVIVVTQLLLLVGPVSSVAAPVVAGGAAIGFAAAARTRRGWWPCRSAAVAAAAVFAVFAAPVVLSGEATFPGYIKLDDTATWLALTDQISERGLDLGGMAPSTHEATLAFTLGKQYPVGAFVPLAIGSRLVGQDPAWLIAPYMATLAAMLALSLWTLSGSLVDSRRMRAVAAFLGAQPALLYGYYLWGGVKEILAATLVATGFGLATAALPVRGLRSAVPTVIVAVALADTLSLAGVVWLAPALAAVAVGAWRGSSPPFRRRAGVGAVIVAFGAAPALAMASFVSPFRTAFTGGTALGNLIRPVSPLELAGVWPAGDFRLEPVLPPVSSGLIAVALVAAAIGFAIAARQRALGILLYVAGALAVAIATQLVAAPWLAGKALAIAAPALLLAAVVAAARLMPARRPLGIALLTVLSGGVLWSNALAYRDVSLAPRDQLAELQTIGGEIEGQGPTLITEYEPYGARHFLRGGDAEGASELRRRPVALVDGGTLPKGASADTDEFRLRGLMTYRTLVLRSSPAQSRPPSPYRLSWSGEYYEVWQRPPGTEGSVIRHLGLGKGFDPGGVPRCADVRSLARAVGPHGSLVAVSRRPSFRIALERTRHPDAWDVAGPVHRLLPTTPGTLEAGLRLARPGDYQVWLGGSVRPQVDLRVDGRSAGEVRDELNNSGEYVWLGRRRLDAGRHTLTVRFGGADLHPGSGGPPAFVGPLVVSSQDAADTRVRRFRPSQAARLCGRRWDWVEATTSSHRRRRS
jgi:hypothetical protein